MSICSIKLTLTLSFSYWRSSVSCIFPIWLKAFFASLNCWSNCFVTDGWEVWVDIDFCIPCDISFLCFLKSFIDCLSAFTLSLKVYISAKASSFNFTSSSVSIGILLYLSVVFSKLNLLEVYSLFLSSIWEFNLDNCSSCWLIPCVACDFPWLAASIASCLAISILFIALLAFPLSASISFLSKSSIDCSFTILPILLAWPLCILEALLSSFSIFLSFSSSLFVSSSSIPVPPDPGSLV